MRLKWHILYIALLWLSVFIASCGNADKESVFVASPELSAIDSLMWHQPDSALAVLTEYKGAPDEFNRHYAELLEAELLFKNDHDQNNRTELIAAMAYFDSLVDASNQHEEIVFLDARAHYMNGVGYYEHDSLPEACAEYLRTLRIMENRFSENELVGKKARFMALTHNRLMEFFSRQFMQEPAIYCGKQSVAYDEIAHSGPIHLAKTFLILGKQYAKMNDYDSAAYYYDLMLGHIPDRNTLIYRDWVAVTALNNYCIHHDAEATLDSLKPIVAQASCISERLNRYLTIGAIYNDIGQYDSAKYYWEPVFESSNETLSLRFVTKYLHEIALKEGDTVKANQYAQVMAEIAPSAPEGQARVSMLNEMFQGYLREKMETASIHAHRKKVMTTLLAMAFLVVVLAAVTFIMRRRHREGMAAREEEAKLQLCEAVQQVRLTLPQRVTDIYRLKVHNRLDRIMSEFEVAYPHVMERFALAYPDLNKAEKQIAVLDFLNFRSKEEADLMGLTESTIFKYRSNLKKKAGSDPISAIITRGKTCNVSL